MPIPNVLIVAIQASASFGGESVLPLHYYKGLKEKKNACKNGCT
jgi:hypothetical protein